MIKNFFTNVLYFLELARVFKELAINLFSFYRFQVMYAFSFSMKLLIFQNTY